jgi:hypothetical protein
MRWGEMRSAVVGSVVVGATLAIAAVGCGDASPPADDGVSTTSGAREDAGADATSSPPLVLVGGDGGLVEAARPCVNLECQQAACTGADVTTVTGKVLDPAGATPLYNAIVYVPNAAVAPFTAGVSCDKCGAPASGSPLVSALTSADGTFTLSNVPSGTDIPLVIQIGRWRRQVKIPTVTACVENRLTDPSLTRLPRNRSEGDIPQMAIATGSSDPMECLLLKMGIDAAEFTPSTGSGRVHYFRENGTDTKPAATAASKLWSQLSSLMKYDLVYLPCEGSATNADDPADHAPAARENLRQYANAGGRVFTTHYSYAWTEGIWPTTATWKLDQTYLDDVTGTLDTSFPKGKAFADWLQLVSTAPATYGKLDIHEGRHDLNVVNTATSQRWISVSPSPSGAKDSVQHMTFNTPLDAGVDDAGASLACGKVVFSDFHVSASALDTSQKYFPKACKLGALSNQEKALEFMIFDLSSCIQKDDTPPAPPVPTPVPR